MKKIAYISFVNFEDKVNIGVKNKILSQLEVLKKEHEVDLYTQSNNLLLTISNDNNRSTNNLGSKFTRYLYIKSLYTNLRNNLPDIVYMRYQFSDPFLIKLIKKLNKSYGVRIFVEIPTYPYYSELKHQGFIGLLKVFVDYIFHFSLFKYVEKIITYSNHDYIYKRNTIKIANAVDFKSIPISHRIHSSEIRLIAVSSMKPWHGYDRLILGLMNYYSVKRDRIVKLILIGNGSEYDYYKKMVSKFELTNHVIFTDSKSGNELDEYFNISDIAVSSLGLHRIKLESASTLKAKEYAARGLPIITASKENTGVDLKYIIKYSADEKPIDVKKIIEFYDSIFNGFDKNISLFIRESVENKYGFDSTFKPVIESMKEDYIND
jgi:hypothetical protein